MKFYLATILLAALCVQALAQIPLELDGVPFNDALENSTSSSRPGNRIIGGSAARVGFLPYQAALQIFISSTSYRICGGSLIATNWIATAAHCVPGATRILVRLGSINYGSGGQELYGSYIYVHSQYNKPSNLNNDIALIKLASNAAINSNVQTIRIAVASLSLSTVRASGWGKTANTGQTSPVLKYADLQIMDTNECARRYVAGLVTANNLCTHNIRDTTCQGDSGGPLVDINTKQLVGVVSFVSAAGCSTGAPAGYAKIANYRTWIRSVTGLNL